MQLPLQVKPLVVRQSVGAEPGEEEHQLTIHANSVSPDRRPQAAWSGPQLIKVAELTRSGPWRNDEY